MRQKVLKEEIGLDGNYGRKAMQTTQTARGWRNIIPSTKQRSYQEIVAYLNERWDKETNTKAAFERMKALDREFGSIAQSLPAIIVAGTNGKSITLHFTTKLLQSEGLKVGTFYTPHILTYNERIACNEEQVSNKVFTEIGNVVIDMAEQRGIDAHSKELLTMMALIFFKESNVDVVLLEASKGGLYDPVNICAAKAVAITRATLESLTATQDDLHQLIHEFVGIVKPGTHIVSGDQVKTSLQLMEELAIKNGGIWAMPIRKLSPLVYPFEQLHGRCAALAERIAQIFMNNFWTDKETSGSDDSLLIKRKGQRGRPTLKAKQLARLNPKKTLDQYWKETTNALPARFQMLDKEKPSILLDNANNLDAFENLLLGVRLLHYQRPLKGLTIILGATQNTLAGEEFLRALRYFFKKTPGQVFVCPISPSALSGAEETTSWNAEQMVNDIKTKKVKATAFKSFSEAFEAAKLTVDERYGLVCISGSQTIISEYWQYKGIKKLG